MYTVNMLSYCKISEYKIKKILKYFVEDYTSMEVSKLTKLSRTTINRYYKIFRRAFRPLIINIIQSISLSENYMGYIKGAYGPKIYLNVYRISERFFLLTKVIGKPVSKDGLLQDSDFEKFREYTHKRFSKFYGFTEQTYYYQLSESSFRYAYPQEELFKMLLKSLKEVTKLNKDKWTYY